MSLTYQIQSRSLQQGDNYRPFATYTLPIIAHLFRALALHNWPHTYISEIHNNDVIISAMASQNTNLTIVYSTVYSGADERKHQSSVSLAFVREFTGHRWIPRTKGK